MSIKHLYEDERPTLLLDFANSKTLDPRITFTRNSTATYVDEMGIIRTAADNEARFDHAGTGECLGLLIEESRTNYVLYSNDVSNAAWIRRGSGLNAAPVTTAPDGTLTAYGAGTGTGGSTRILAAFTATGGWQTGVYATNLTSEWQYFTTDPINHATLGNRFAFYGVVIDANNHVSQELGSSLPAGDYVLSGWAKTDGTNIWLWGLQVEAGTFATSLIPTTAATATRAADVCTITGTNFSSWYAQGPNSVVTEFSSPFASPLTAVGAFTDGTTSNRISYRPRGYYLMTSGGGGNDFQFGLTPAQLPANTPLKIGYSLDTTGAFIVSGDASNSDVKTLPMPIGLNQMVIGKVEDLTLYLNGPISRISYYPTRLSNTALEALTK